MSLQVLYRCTLVVASIVTFIFLFFPCYNVVLFGKYVEQEPKAMERPSFQSKMRTISWKISHCDVCSSLHHCWILLSLASVNQHIRHFQGLIHCEVLQVISV